MQICLALKYLHKKNILHRDIKPSNILLMKEESEDFAKLGDFGLAKILDSPFKHTSTLIDTPQYGAPEIIEKKSYSFKVDIWSLGVIFYQLVILDYPFEGCTNEEKQKNILVGKKKEIPKDCNFDPKFIELLNEMLSLKPEERPTAEEILEKPIIKIRMKCYLDENGFDVKKSNLFIEQYEQNDNNNNNEEIRVNVFDEFEDDDKNETNEEVIKKAEEKRFKRIRYDFNRQMTYIDEVIRKSNTFPKKEK